jgi:putative SOS response-associated peptidase YedK
MPVILNRTDYDPWLDPKSSPTDLQELLRPWAGKMTAVAAPKPGATKLEATEKRLVMAKARVKKADPEPGLFG